MISHCSGGRTQVELDHYDFLKYENTGRFQLYYNILREALELQPCSAIEIGKGNGAVSHFLRTSGVRVCTVDIESRLSPDVVADVRCLPFREKSVDCVIASQILEHIPWEDIGQVLKTFSSISDFVVLSVPFNRHNIDINIKIRINRYLYFRGLINRLIDRISDLNLNIGRSQKHTEFIFDGEHHWEIGYNQYPLVMVRDLISTYFEIKKEFRVKYSPYHYIFVLRSLSKP